MVKKTKNEFRVAGNFLGGRGVLLVLVAIVLTVFESVLKVQWWQVMPVIVLLAIGLYFAESKLKASAGRRALAKLNLVVAGLRYVGANSESLAQREFIERQEVDGKESSRVVMEHLCVTQNGLYFLLRYNYLFGCISHCVVEPCSEATMLAAFPEVYEERVEKVGMA